MKSITNFLLVSSGSDLIGKIYHKIYFIPSIVYYFNKELENCESVLDLRCGNNSPLRYTQNIFLSIGIEILLGYAHFRGVGGLKLFGRDYNSQILFMLIQSLPQKSAYFIPKFANGIPARKKMENQ